MERKIIQIKDGIKLHLLNTELFKTNLVVIFITVPMKKETVTRNALIPAILKSGSKSMPTQEIISKDLENMYGATFDCGADKNGDNQVLKFYIESVDDKFLPNNEKVLETSINKLIDIVFNPILENQAFNQKYFDTEKENLKKLIESKKDDKDAYALHECVNKMYGDEGFGIYKYGYIEDLEKISNDSLYESYKKLIREAKIDIFVSGDFNDASIENLIKQNEIIMNLDGRNEEYIVNAEQNEIKQKVQNVKEITENLDVVQGKLVIGLDILSRMENLRYVAILYNTILGDGANSMLFQNVREKASLAYSTRSVYVKQKSNIFIKCGIEVENFEKAMNIIKEQLENIKQGKFTEENIENAKRYIMSGIDSIETEQDTGVVYYMGQELSNSNTSPDEYKNKIKSVTREQIIELANGVELNTIYFLRN